jgi:hypothetical protein
MLRGDHDHPRCTDQPRNPVPRRCTSCLNARNCSIGSYDSKSWKKARQNLSRAAHCRSSRLSSDARRAPSVLTLPSPRSLRKRPSERKTSGGKPVAKTVSSCLARYLGQLSPRFRVQPPIAVDLRGLKFCGRASQYLESLISSSPVPLPCTF